MAKTLYIIRGIPGSGKSTFAKGLLNEFMRTKQTAYHYESDEFFMVDGEYKFDGSKLGAAHASCFNNIKSAIVGEVENVIVSNTFTTMKEMKDYLDLAERNGYDVKVFRMMGSCTDPDADILTRFADFKNEHKVPIEVLYNMANRFYDYDGEAIIRPCERLMCFTVNKEV